MSWELIVYTTFMWLGFLGLYSLRNMSIEDNFSSNGPIIGFATLIQKLTASIGILAFIIVAIIKSKWYVPFASLLIGGILSAILGKVLTSLQIMRASSQKTESGMLISAIITLVSLILLYFHDY